MIPGSCWTGQAPAKVNLFLRVLAREESGYHQLETLFQALELADEVTLEWLRLPTLLASGSPDPQGIELEVEGVPAEALGPPEANLAVRAARLFFEALPGVRDTLPRLRIHLRKRIPHGAGLGGGSSDAATVLRGLNELLGNPLDAGALATLGARLGADVAFFLCGSPLALAWGRGDRLLPLPPLPRAPVVLLLPARRIATPEAYGVLARSRVDADRPTPPARVFAPDAAPWTDWTSVAREAENDFEVALAPAYPELVHLRRVLEEAGARPALLSGSGSAVFGVFRSGSEPPTSWHPDRFPGSPTPEAALTVIRTATRSRPDPGQGGEGGARG